MMLFLKKNVLTFTLFLFCLCQINLYAEENQSDVDFLTKGYEAFYNGDWDTSSLLLKKAISSPENFTAEVWYMLIMCYVNSGKYGEVVSSASIFFENFDDSDLKSYVLYQQGKAYHLLNQNDSAVLVLSDFCHQNPESELYSSALYWLGECFFADYNYETARALYERVVSDFPDSSKCEDSKFKLDMINQREREQKLLYLLKMTGEEYLYSKENYEKQLKEYQTQDIVSLRKQLKDATQRIKELEESNSKVLENAKNQEKILEEIRNKNQELEKENIEQKILSEQKEKLIDENMKNDLYNEQLLILKSKADLLRSLYNEEKGDE